jgi:hypothetical protein
LIDSRQSLQSATLRFIEGEFNILNQLAETDEERQELAVRLQEERVRFLELQQQAEQRRLNIQLQQEQSQQRQNQLALIQEQIQNRIAQTQAQAQVSQARAGVAQAQADIASADADPTTRPEARRALELQLQAAQDQVAASQSQLSNLRGQEALLSKREDLLGEEARRNEQIARDRREELRLNQSTDSRAAQLELAGALSQSPSRRDQRRGRDIVDRLERSAERNVNPRELRERRERVELPSLSRSGAPVINLDAISAQLDRIAPTGTQQIQLNETIIPKSIEQQTRALTTFMESTSNRIAFRS